MNLNPEMKKKILIVAAAVICLAIVGGGTLAYFADSATAHNVITSGGVDIALVEQMKDSSGRWVPFENQSGVMPGTDVSKKVTVKSAADSAPCWVRVQLIFSNDKMQIVYNSADWIEHGGCYYYKTILPAGSETAPLFDTVQFAADMGNEYQNAKLELKIVAEAVQSDNNPIPRGGQVWNVGGWDRIRPLVRKIFN